jgi:L-threonylcarbamoyladenylate synthase
MSPVIDDAVDALRRGGLVGLPTETVYGLGADADNAVAVRRIFELKQRPSDHPLIVHIAGADELHRWAADIPPNAARLAELCWPGPLTLILPAATRVLAAVTGGRPTVGVRVPAHDVAIAVLRAFGGGIAAPSANRFGRVSPTTAAHVVEEFGDAVDVVLDGGPCPIGVESTIVDCSAGAAQILRPGGIPNEAIVELLRGDVTATVGPSRAPGMLASHYAPAAAVIVCESIDEARRLVDQRSGARLIGDGLTVTDYARSLYALLREADSDGVTTVVALAPPADGLGQAIRDRLAKAAHRST